MPSHSLLETVARLLSKRDKFKPKRPRATCHPSRPMHGRGLCRACHASACYRGTLKEYPLTPGGTTDHVSRWRAAVGEAASLIQLEVGGCVSNPGRAACTRGCRDISDVLDIGASDRQILREFVEAHPEEHSTILSAIRFRRMVSEAVIALRKQQVAA